MDFANPAAFLAKLLGAVAVILAPLVLVFQTLGILVGAPLLTIGLVLASPGLAALHAFKRTGLRHHAALEFLVGAALGVFCANLIAISNPDPHDIKALTVQAAAIFALLGGGCGAWSGLIWWAFLGRREPRSPPSAQCKVSAAIE